MHKRTIIMMIGDAKKLNSSQSATSLWRCFAIRATNTYEPMIKEPINIIANIIPITKTISISLYFN